MGDYDFDPRAISDEQLYDIVKIDAEKLGIAPYPVPNLLVKVREYYDDWGRYLDFRWKVQYDNYVQACINWALNEIRDENPIENQMYLELARYTDSVDESENKRISKIIEMLSTRGIFPKDEKSCYTLNDVMKWLDSDQTQALVDAIMILKDYCDAEGVRVVLESADINETKWKILLQDPNGSNLSENAKKYQPATFVRRLELMTRYIKDTADEKFSETETFSARYWLRSTGSDPHCEGRHALFLVNKSTNKIEYVYKPHDLSADNVVVGEDGMLVQINKFFRENDLLKGTPIEGQDAFAVVHIEPEKHLETYVEKLPVMTSEEAKDYFYKAGMLQVVTDAMAVTDLHQDNIMPTVDGPLIIDAEVDFFRVNFSGLLSALTWVDSDEDPKNASFLIDEGEGETVRSWKAFQNEKLTYRAMYIAGQEFMRDEMQRNKDYLLREFDKQLHRVTRSRILPMATRDFSNCLDRAIGLRKTRDFTYVQTVGLEMVGPNNNTSELASGIVNEIVKKFANIKECYIFTEKAGVYLSANRFGSSIMETFKNGTIIAMYITMDGDIYLDDKKIGYLYELEDNTNESVKSSQEKTNIVTRITMNGDIYIYDEKKWSLLELKEKSDESTELPKQLSKEQVIQMIKDHFMCKLEEYKRLNGGKTK